MVDPLLIGCGAGFSDDRTDVALPVVRAMRRRGLPAVLFYETLGERTLALAHLRERENAETGYAPLLDDMVRPVLRTCLEAGIAVIGNFGAANPRAAARRIAAMAVAEGFADAAVGVVEGDDVTHLLHDGALEPMGLDSVLPDSAPICANAYLGAGPIVAALARGARIVVTGRVADPSLVVAPALHHFGWRADQLDRLADATLAGHLLECGSQVTGGYFADPGVKDVPDPHAIGFPIGELAADGGLVIGKPEGTGGLVTPATVKEQLLYEIHDPAAYLTPDVTLDVTGVEVEAIGPDRVAVRGAAGAARPARLKVTVSVDGGWLGEGEISYAGPNAVARGRLALDILRRRLPADLRVRSDLIGVASVFASDAERFEAAPEAGDVRARIAVEASSRDVAERAMREVTALLCCGPAGGGGARTAVRRRVHTWSATAAREAVDAGVAVTVRSAGDWQGGGHA